MGFRGLGKSEKKPRLRRIEVKIKAKWYSWIIGTVLTAAIVLGQGVKHFNLAQSQLPCLVKEENTVNTNSNDAEIDRAVGEEMCAQKLYGLATGIVKDGKIIYLKGYGYEDLENKIPVQAKKTMFRWASLSKSVTGVAAVREVFAGNLDLDADVRKYVPEYKFPATYAYPLEDGKFDIRRLPDSPKPFITTRMLLSHTSGIKNFSNGPSKAGTPPENLVNDPNVNTGIFWAGKYFWDDPNHLLYIPGTKDSYSVYGYTLAGMVIERAGERKTYWEKVRDGIAVPFGMTPASFPNHPGAGYQSGSFFQPDYEWVNIPHRAVGYRYDKKTGSYNKSGSVDVSWRMPAAGFISTVENLAQYCNGLMNREDVVSAKMKEDFLWKGSQLSDGTFISASMGFGMGETDGRRRIGAMGGQQKTRTRLGMYQDEGICFVLMTNSEWANIDEVFNVLEKAYRNKKLPLNGG
jgi:serine beta-lactamase-like protein LACTB